MWDGGLQEQEVLAIEKIKAAFSANVSKPDKPVRGGSIGEQLQSYGFTGNGMFPWKGYAGFRFVEAKKEGEFDLVIVTHCNVIIVELKDWNHQPVTARGDTWYKGDMNMGRSPVSVTRGKIIHYSMVMNKVTDKHNVLQEDRGIGKCMINRILWAVMN
ncbi:NERD domain-containing protein [Klebsiella pneumoniae]|nr:NERD domain-containing protein [Klebsiella pneumoniae]